MLEAILDSIELVLARGGWVSWALVVVSIAMWGGLVLRWQALRRGVDGPIETVVLAHCDGRAAVTAEQVARFILPRYVMQGVHLVDVHSDAVPRLAADARRAAAELATFRSVVRVLVAAAPLLGLLGTVGGMVEMFSSLHGGALAAAKEATVAGGISKALVTTQLGLIIAVPGLVGVRYLERREVKLTLDIERARAALSQRAMEIHAQAAGDAS